MARRVLIDLVMKPENTQNGAGPNPGEGDTVSARHYTRGAREFVAEGKVDEAARDAARFVEADPKEAQRAEEAARKGPHGRTRVSVDELVAKGRTVVDRVRPIVDRVVDRVRSKISRSGRKS